jgi:hypothetical protein
MSTVKVTDIQKKEWKNLAKIVKKGGSLGGDVIDIGLFGEQGSDLVAYAAKNEFGYSNTPARPFLRSTLSVNMKKILDFIKTEKYNLLFEGNIKKTMGRIGLFVEGLVKKRITTARSWAKPLSPKTIKRKGSSAPLIDSNRMRMSITHRVRRRVAGEIIKSIGSMQ